MSELAFRFDWVVIIGAVILFGFHLFLLEPKKPRIFIKHRRIWVALSVFCGAAIFYLNCYVTGRTVMFSFADMIWWIIGIILYLFFAFHYAFYYHITLPIFGFAPLDEASRRPEFFVKRIIGRRELLADFLQKSKWSPIYTPLSIMFLILFWVMVRWVGVVPYSNALILGSAWVVFILVVLAGLERENSIWVILHCFSPQFFKDINIIPPPNRRLIKWASAAAPLISMGFILPLPALIGDAGYKTLISWLGLPGLIFIGTLIFVTFHAYIIKVPFLKRDFIANASMTNFCFLCLSLLTIYIGLIGFWIVFGLTVAFLLIVIIERDPPKPKAYYVLMVLFVSLLALETEPRLLSQYYFRKAESSVLSGDYLHAQKFLQEGIAKIRPYQKVLKMFHVPDSLAVVPKVRLQQASALSAQIELAYSNYARVMEQAEARGWSYTSKKDAIENYLLKTQIYQALRDRAKEEEMIKKAWEVANKTFDRPYWTAHVNRYRARLEMDKGNYEDANKILKDVKKIGKRIGSYKLISSALSGSGDTYFKQEKYSEAEGYYSEALNLSRKYNAKGDEAIYLLKLAKARKKMGHLVLASKNLSEAINLAGRISSHEILWQSLYEKGLLKEDQGKREEARKSYIEAISIIDMVRGRLSKEEYRLGYMTNKKSVFEHTVSLACQMGSVGDAFEYVQKAKSRVFLDLLGTRMVAFRDEDRELASKERLLQIRVNALLERVREEESKPKRLQRRKLKEWKGGLQKALKEHDQIKTEIKRTNPRLASLTTTSTVNVSDVQNVLRPDKLFLEYFVTDEKTILWGITVSDVRTFEIPLGKDKLGEMTSRICGSFGSSITPSMSELNEAYGLILKPALEYFSNKSHIIIAPYDKLYFLPFETLVMDKTSPTYIVDRYFVSYYPSGSVLVLNRKYQEKKLLPPKPLFAVGDPVFDPDDPRCSPKDKRSIQQALAGEERGVLYRRVMMDDSIIPLSEIKEQVSLPRLLATDMEVKAISSLLRVPEGSEDIKLGLSASEKEVKETDHTKYRYEHYATHGVLRGDIPGLKEPALVFSLPNPEDPAIDEGFLTMSEIFGLRTNADMVVLSACNTALGEEVPGEGLIGLTRAFMYAGTPSVVASLWSVADESTAKFMSSYYNYLQQGKDKAEALTLAKRELKRQGYYNPFYWAPFILIGEK